MAVHGRETGEEDGRGGSEQEQEQEESNTEDESKVLSDGPTRVGAPTEPPRTFDRITLEKLDENLFRARKEDLWAPRGRKAVFGGQVLGQSLAAAIQTVLPDKHLHSMHGYFVRAGQATRSIIYSVLPLRDGSSFATRVVTAQQEGRPIFILIASFQKDEQSRLVHQNSMPIVPAPEHLMSEEEYYTRLANDPRCPENWKMPIRNRAKRENPIDIRLVLTADPFRELGAPPADLPEYPKFTTAPKQLLWMKTKKPLPDDPNVHRSVLAYASDLAMLTTAVGGFPMPYVSMVASLDHSMWFHSPFRMDEWVLFELESPRAGSARGLTFGRAFRRDGVLAVTIGQEGVIRLRPDDDHKTLSDSKPKGGVGRLAASLSKSKKSKL